MATPWEEKEVLIIVKAYPEYSHQYTETVCTAGILKDTGGLIRIYPIRFRYLEDDKRFSKYQWIKAELRHSTKDNRPESYQINDDSIKLGTKIDSSEDGWVDRERWVLSPQNLCSSLENLINARAETNKSLGIVKPKEIIRLKIELKKQVDIEEASKKKSSIMDQLEMLEEKRDLELLPVKFILHFLCDDSNCKGHRLSILDWEIGQLYRKIKNNVDWKEKITHKIMNEICNPKRETFLILGNMVSHPHVFCILGFFWPPKQRQLKML